MSLMVRYHLASRRHSIDEVPQMARDLFKVGAALARLVFVVAVLVAALWARRRWRGWLERWRSATFRSLTSVAWQTEGPVGIQVVRDHRPVGPVSDHHRRSPPGVGTRRRDHRDRRRVDRADHFRCVPPGHRRRGDDCSSTSQSITGLTRPTAAGPCCCAASAWFFGSSTILVVIRLVSRGMGQGFFGTLVTKFAWVVVLAAVLVELFRWRGVMVDTFLKLQPTGQLADTLRGTRSRWYGAFLAPAAFVWLAGRGAATVVREFALGFEQTQKALAFLFRQRVQRQAEKQGYAEGDVGELPEGLVEAFAEEAIEAGTAMVAGLSRAWRSCTGSSPRGGTPVRAALICSPVNAASARPRGSTRSVARTWRSNASFSAGG